jgi:hypothetical protein
MEWRGRTEGRRRHAPAELLIREAKKKERTRGEEEEREKRRRRRSRRGRSWRPPVEELRSLPCRRRAAMSPPDRGGRRCLKPEVAAFKEAPTRL